ncbi:unnamed protein product, partial [Ectocarpus sp. 4 AP-2014]
MDVDTSWRRKRPAIEEEDYLASKRYISEKFFNMRISHPDAPGLHGAGLMWQGAADKAAGVGSGDLAAGVDCNSMSDEEDIATATGRRPPAAAPSLFTEGAAFGDLASLDEDDDASGGDDGAGDTSSVGGGPPTPHPFLRSTSSAIDEKVDDWVRTSRHRMLADASVNSAPDLCRALIAYQPVAGLMPSAAPVADSTGDEEGRASGYDSGEAGGDPTPSPQAGGDGGGDTAPTAAATAGAGLGAVMLGGERGCEQSAGSSTAEAAGFAGAGGRTGGHPHGYANGNGGGGRSDQGKGRNHHHHHHVAGSLFGPPPRGLCTAQSGGDDAGGALMMHDDSGAASMREGNEAAMIFRDGDAGGRGDGALPAAAAASADAMDMDETDMAPPDAIPLSRIGSSRGAPTPELTPERAAWARAAPQRRREARGEEDPDEIAGATNARPPLTAQSCGAVDPIACSPADVRSHARSHYMTPFFSAAFLHAHSSSCYIHRSLCFFLKELRQRRYYI